MKLAFTDKFGRSISRETICKTFRENNLCKPVILGAVEKYWIVENAKKYFRIPRERMAMIFTAELGRSINRATIRELNKRQKKAEIIEEFASWAENNSVKIKPQEVDCKTEPDDVVQKYPIADKTYLTTAEKYWIVEHAEKNQDLSTTNLACDFAAKFGRNKSTDTIQQILNRKKEIRHEFASWAENFEMELNEAVSIRLHCKQEPDNQEEIARSKSNKSSNKWLLTTAQKDWIVQHGERNKDMSFRRLAQDFTAEFSRPVCPSTIDRLLKERNVPREPVRQKFVSSNPPRKKEVAKKFEKSVRKKSFPIPLLPKSL